MQLPQIIPTQKYQVALFPSDPTMLGSGNNNWSSLFTRLAIIADFSGGNNALLPVPPDAPLEIPRIILKSTDGAIACSISPLKIDIFWENTNDDANFSALLDQRISLTRQIVDAINVSFKRVGSIHFFYFPIASDPVRNEVFRDNVNQALRDYTLSLTYNDTVDGIRCNRLLTLSNGSLSATGTSVVFVTADFNTHQDESLSWSFLELERFLATVDSSISKESVFEKIFPEQQ